MVGQEATEAERCHCLSPIPLLPGEDVDAGVERLGRLPGWDDRQLIWGSLLRARNRGMLERQADDLGQIEFGLQDLKEVWEDLQPAELDDASLDQVSNVLMGRVEQVRQALEAAAAALRSLHDRSAPTRNVGGGQ
jgi:hypothetical protein